MFLYLECVMKKISAVIPLTFVLLGASPAWASGLPAAIAEKHPELVKSEHDLLAQSRVAHVQKTATGRMSHKEVVVQHAKNSNNSHL